MFKNLLLLLLLSAPTIAALAQKPAATYLFAGTYTDNKPDKGIYIYRFNAKTGKLKKTGNASNITNPSYLDISPNGQFVYSCTDTRMSTKGSVSAFRVDSLRGKLSFINKQSAGAANPVYLSVHNSNKFIVSGSYTEASVTVFTANDDGSLNPYTQLLAFSDSSIIKGRQDEAHVHSAVFSPANDYLFLPDLGADKIRIFQFDASQAEPLIHKEDHKNVPGSGPRHFAFHPRLPFAYCIEELSGMVSAYAYNNGGLQPIQRIFSHSQTYSSYSGADIHISPDGLFLYASNRGDENRIAIFSIDQSKGTLSLVGYQSTYGNHPRNFTLDPSGQFLLVANQYSNNIVVFKRDSKTGLLHRVGRDIKIPSPSCLKMRSYRP
ncbi:MAG: lactonase family protein [Chitinophagaceae bacterium]|nr:lactonase family protein [Chitinophagaceae bacterium]